MHYRIREVATSVKGLDRDPKLVERATNEGWQMTLGDAQSFDLGERFDVLWAGELIEHLSNPGGFLDSALRHLAPSGRLVLTTPNAFAVSNFVYRLWGTVRVNLDHACWYCADTLGVLLNRHGFVIEEMAYLKHWTPGRVRRLLAELRCGRATPTDPARRRTCCSWSLQPGG